MSNFKNYVHSHDSSVHILRNNICLEMCGSSTSSVIVGKKRQKAFASFTVED